MSDVSFNTIPSALRLPLFYAEVDNSRANSGNGGSQRALIVGPKLSTGIGVADTPILCQGVAHAKTIGGVGSVLALMVSAYRAADNFGEVWMLPVSDDPQATAATGSLSFTAPATDTGVLSLYVAGVLVSMTVSTSLTVANLAAALVALVNAKTDLPVAAAVDSSTNSKVNFTAKNKGLVGNEIDLRLNYGGESTPTGLAVTVVSLAGGLVNPSLTNGLANLLDKEFDFIANPFVDTASLDVFKALMSSKTGRWSWNRMVYGHVWSGLRGTLGTLGTFGTTRNDEHMTLMGFNDSPSPGWVLAADLAGSAAVPLKADAARPLQTIALSTFLPPPLASRFGSSDRNVLLYDGISTFTVADDGTVAIERAITTYQKNAYGQPDDSYLAVEDLYNLAGLLRRLRSVVTSRYSRVKLADNGTRPAAGSSIVTPNTVRADIIGQYSQEVDNGYADDLDDFIAALVVERNSTNPKRLDMLWPVNLIPQLNIFAVLAQFRLQ